MTKLTRRKFIFGSIASLVTAPSITEILIAKEQDITNYPTLINHLNQTKDIDYLSFPLKDAMIAIEKEASRIRTQPKFNRGKFENNLDKRQREFDRYMQLRGTFNLEKTFIRYIESLNWQFRRHANFRKVLYKNIGDCSSMSLFAVYLVRSSKALPKKFRKSIRLAKAPNHSLIINTEKNHLIELTLIPQYANPIKLISKKSLKLYRISYKQVLNGIFLNPFNIKEYLEQYLHDSIIEPLAFADRTQEVIPYLETALELNPRSMRSYFNIILCKSLSADLEGATRYARMAIKQDPEKTSIHYITATCLEKRNNLDKRIQALEWVDKGIKNIRNKNKISYDYFKLLTRKTSLLSKLDKKQELTSTVQEFRFKQFDFKPSARNYKRLADSFMKVNAKDSQLDEFQIKRRAIGYYNKAIQRYTKQLKRAKKSYHLKKRAVCYYNKRAYQEALTDINKALEIRTKSQYLITRQLIYEALGQTEKAKKDSKFIITHLEKLEKRNPKNINNQFSIINQVIKYSEDPKKALPKLTYLKSLCPDDSQIYMLEAKVAVSLENHDQAILSYLKAIELDKTNSDAYAATGDCFLHLAKKDRSHYQESISFYSKALKIKSDPDYLIKRAKAYKKLGKTENMIDDLFQAISILEKDLIIFNKDRLTLINLVTCYSLLRNNQKTQKYKRMIK